MKAPSEIIIKPLISEKSYANMQFGKYTFVVHPSANKVEIKRAVEEHWGVKVLSVNTLNVMGKERRRRTSKGFDPARKKAVVTLAPGEQIKDLFETTSG